MANHLEIIEKKINSPSVAQDLMLALDLAPGEEDAIREAKKYTGSVLMEIKRTQGTGNYTDLTTANPDSIVQSMIDAAKFKLQIDGRKLCYLEKRGNNVSLQINANGFVAKIKESYPDATFVMTPVFNGDPAPSIKQHADGNKSCEFTSTNVFGDPKDLNGILVQISYTDHGGKQVSDVQAVPINDLRAMQAQSKSKAWGTYTIERMKTAALKRATKWHFRQNATLQAIIDYDNQTNFNPEPATPVRNTIIDNINASVADSTAPASETEQMDTNAPDDDITPPQQAENAEPVTQGTVIDATVEDEQPEQDNTALIDAGKDAAKQGVVAYKAWIATLSDAQKDLVRHNHQDWTEIANAATKAAATAHQPVVDTQTPPPTQNEPVGAAGQDYDAPPI